MTVPSVHCEAKKVAYRQSKDGLVISFVIHPNDMPDSLATAPLGQRYMLALAAIGDDEQAIAGSSAAEQVAVNHPVAGSIPAPRATSPMERAVQRAGILATDERFRKWIVSGPVPCTTTIAAQYIRDVCCDGRSRGLIAEDPECYQRFLAMEQEYKMAVGLAAEPR